MSFFSPPPQKVKKSKFFSKFALKYRLQYLKILTQSNSKHFPSSKKNIFKRRIYIIKTKKKQTSNLSQTRPLPPPPPKKVKKSTAFEDGDPRDRIDNSKQPRIPRNLPFELSFRSSVAPKLSFCPDSPLGGRNPLNPVTLLRIVDVHVMSPVHCVHNEGLGDSTPESAFGTFPEGRGRETCRLSRRSVTCPGIHALVRGRSTETVRARVVPSTGATSVPFFSTIVDRGWPRFAFWPRAVDRE